MHLYVLRGWGWGGGGGEKVDCVWWEIVDGMCDHNYYIDMYFIYTKSILLMCCYKKNVLLPTQISCLIENRSSFLQPLAPPPPPPPVFCKSTPQVPCFRQQIFIFSSPLPQFFCLLHFWGQNSSVSCVLGLVSSAMQHCRFDPSQSRLVEGILLLGLK